MSRPLETPVEIYSDDNIKIMCMDEKGAGGAHHLYHIYPLEANVEYDNPMCVIKHQEGSPQEEVNGITVEALLAICKHRMICFQNGLFPSHFNVNAESGISFALNNLNQRTQERKRAGILGEQKAQ